MSGRRGARAGGEASAAVPFVVGLGQTFPRAPPGVRRGGAGAGPGSRGGRGRAHGRDGPGGGREAARARSTPKLLLLAPLSCKKGAQEKEASPPCSLGTYPAGGTRRFSLRAGSGERAQLQKERQKSPTPLPAPPPVLPRSRARISVEFGGVGVGCRSNSWPGRGGGGGKASLVCVPCVSPARPGSDGRLQAGGGGGAAAAGRGTRRAGVRPGPAPGAMPELQSGCPVPGTEPALRFALAVPFLSECANPLKS